MSHTKHTPHNTVLFTARYQATNLKDFRFRKLVVRVSFTLENLIATATLPHHILSIVAFRSQKQMVTIEARTVVAMMKNALSLGNGTVFLFPR